MEFYALCLFVLFYQACHVTSTRLLATSIVNHQRIQFDTDGDELRRMFSNRTSDMEPQHAVESPTGSFVVSRSNRQLMVRTLKVNIAGKVLREFSGS